MLMQLSTNGSNDQELYSVKGLRKMQQLYKTGVFDELIGTYLSEIKSIELLNKNRENDDIINQIIAIDKHHKQGNIQIRNFYIEWLIGIRKPLGSPTDI